MITFKLTIIKKFLPFFILVVISTAIKAQNEIPFLTNKGLPIVKLELNGKHAYFVIDTGASISMLDNSIKKHYGFYTRNVYRSSSKSSVLGLGGRQELEQARNVLITIKGEKIECINFKSTNLSNLRRSLNIVGIIGSDFLIEQGYTIDFEKKVLIKITPLLENTMPSSC